MSEDDQRAVVDDLLARRGTTYAAEAGITLTDEPGPLFRLLVLTTLAAARIPAAVAAAAAREVLAAGRRTPAGLRDAPRRQLVAALGRAGYRRYDESTATKLRESAAYLLDEHAGDLRRLRPDGPSGRAELLEALTRFPRVGPVGASVFTREVQAVWPVGPYLDGRAARAARAHQLPADPDRLAALAPEGRFVELAAALARTPARGSAAARA